MAAPVNTVADRVVELKGVVKRVLPDECVAVPAGDSAVRLDPAPSKAHGLWTAEAVVQHQQFYDQLSQLRQLLSNLSSLDFDRSRHLQVAKLLPNQRDHMRVSKRLGAIRHSCGRGRQLFEHLQAALSTGCEALAKHVRLMAPVAGRLGMQMDVEVLAASGEFLVKLTSASVSAHISFESSSGLPHSVHACAVDDESFVKPELNVALCAAVAQFHYEDLEQGLRWLAGRWKLYSETAEASFMEEQSILDSVGFTFAWSVRGATFVLCKWPTVANQACDVMTTTMEADLAWEPLEEGGTTLAVHLHEAILLPSAAAQFFQGALSGSVDVEAFHTQQHVSRALVQAIAPGCTAVRIAGSHEAVCQAICHVIQPDGLFVSRLHFVVLHHAAAADAIFVRRLPVAKSGDAVQSVLACLQLQAKFNALLSTAGVQVDAWFGAAPSQSMHPVPLRVVVVPLGISQIGLGICYEQHARAASAVCCGPLVLCLITLGRDAYAVTVKAVGARTVVVSSLESWHAAWKLGTTFEGMTDAVASSVLNSVGHLPLLVHTLARAWQAPRDGFASDMEDLPAQARKRSRMDSQAT